MINNKNTKNNKNANTKKRSFLDMVGETLPHSPSGNERMAYVNAGGYITYIVG